MTSYACPTLLHLSARYGLQELAVRLVDLPDARLACHIKDLHGCRPEDVAQQCQHHSLVSFFHNFREMVITSYLLSLAANYICTLPHLVRHISAGQTRLELENVAINDVLPLKAARRDAIANLKCFRGLGHQRPNFDG